VLSLSGCQTVSEADKTAVVDTPGYVQLRESRLRELTNFQVGGGLSIWTETESIPARISWTQSGADLALNLVGPLGLGELDLQDNSGVVTLSRGKTVVTSGTSSDDVIQRGLGLTAPVPVEELKQWIRGLAGSGEEIIRDSNGKLSSLRYLDQSGVLWSVRFKRYETVNGLSLPALITASGGAYAVRLILKNWNFITNFSESGAKELKGRLSIPVR